MFDKFKQSLTKNVYQCKVEFNSSGGTYIDSQSFKCGAKIENYSKSFYSTLKEELDN